MIPGSIPFVPYGSFTNDQTSNEFIYRRVLDSPWLAKSTEDEDINRCLSYLIELYLTISISFSHNCLKVKLKQNYSALSYDCLFCQ